MNPTLVAGTIIVTFAMAAYSIAIIGEQRRHRVSDFALTFLTLGVVLDITATACMIAGSPNSPFTLHGFVGYSALAFMLSDSIAVWRFRLRNRAEVMVSRSLHLYSRFAYLWWVAAYITGGLLVALAD